MRDIKFQAWDRYNKVWIGSYTLKQLADDDQFNYDTEVHPICSKFEDFNWVEYIGRRDRKGSEIYEGHVLAYGNNRGLVKDIFTWVWLQVEDEEGNASTDILDKEKPLSTMTGFEQAEIVGHICENPELVGM